MNIEQKLEAIKMLSIKKRNYTDLKKSLDIINSLQFSDVKMFKESPLFFYNEEIPMNEESFYKARAMVCDMLRDTLVEIELKLDEYLK